MSYELHKSQRMTVIHLITELNMGGAEQMLARLVLRMDRQAFRCIVVSMTEKGPIGENLTQEGIPVLALGMRRGKPTLRGLVRLYHFLRQESADLIQSWLYHADLLGLLIGRLAGVKRIIWGIRCSDLHLRQYRLLTAFTVRVCGFISPFADAIIVNSQAGRDIHAKRGYKTGRMFVIPNGFDTDRFHPDESARDWLLDSLGLGPEAVLIGLVARFDPMKDQPNFLQAAQLLAREDPTAHFVMVGRGVVPHNRILRPFLDGLSGRVHLLGLRTDIPRLTAALDIASSSSAFGEGFSNTIGEAMLCGIPCAVTDVGDSAQIVGDTGIVVPPRDPKALAEAWSDLLRMGKEARTELGNRARQRMMADYEIGKIVQSFEQFYRKLMGGLRPQEGA